MANLDTALARARKVTGPKAAAKLYADLEYELALGDPSAEQEREGDDALAVLEERFPGVKSGADNALEDGHIPNMSRTAKGSAYADAGPARTTSTSSPDGERAGDTSTQTKPTPNGPKVSPAPITPAARRRVAARRQTRSQPRRSSGFSGDRAVRQAKSGIQFVNQNTGNWGQTLGDFILGGIGLSLAYLFLTHPKGPTELSAGITNLVGAVVSPSADPLNPATWPKGSTK